MESIPFASEPGQQGAGAGVPDATVLSLPPPASRRPSGEKARQMT